MDSVVHFEMPYDDRERMARFYEAVFGWKTEMLGEEMGNYVVTTTTATDEDGPVNPGAINGGLYPRTEASQGPSFVIAVADIAAGIEAIKAAGGTVEGEPVEIPGVGPYVAFTDTEGNRLSILQPLPRGGQAGGEGAGGEA